MTGNVTGQVGFDKAGAPAAAPAAANLTRTRIIALAIVLSITIALAFNRGYQLGIDVSTVGEPAVDAVDPVEPNGSDRTDRSPALRRADSRARGQRPGALQPTQPDSAEPVTDE